VYFPAATRCKPPALAEISTGFIVVNWTPRFTGIFGLNDER